MEIEHKIAHIEGKKMVGKRISMSLLNNQTYLLWNGFMKERNKLVDVVGNELYSIALYPEHYFDAFNPRLEFEKWACAEVSSLNQVPENFESMHLPGGMYAVFLLKGKAEESRKTLKYIFEIWLPQSKYDLDRRPHFEVMGKKYQHNSEESEEEAFIPIILKEFAGKL